MKTTKLIAIAATILMCLPLALLAQNPPNDSASGPIDGGILTLVAGAAVMGYKKMKERKAAKKEE